MKTVERRRVVITGVGAVTPLGNTAEEFWAALIQGKSGIGPITSFDASALPTKIAAELKGFDPLRYMDKKDDRKLHRRQHGRAHDSVGRGNREGNRGCPHGPGGSTTVSG